MPDDLGRRVPSRLSGTERLTNAGTGEGRTVLDFWQWSTSDLLGNTVRGVLAEYLVALATGVDLTSTRDEWAATDLCTPEGITIQVKSAAFLQSWFQERLSTISFNVQPRRAWDPNTNRSETTSTRHSDVYIFALLAHRDKASVNPLDTSQWRFYVIPTSTLDARTRSQHSITLGSLERLVGHGRAFNEIRDAVLAAVPQRAV